MSEDLNKMEQGMQEAISRTAESRPPGVPRSYGLRPARMQQHGVERRHERNADGESGMGGVPAPVGITAWVNQMR